MSRGRTLAWPSCALLALSLGCPSADDAAEEGADSTGTDEAETTETDTTDTGTETAEDSSDSSETDSSSESSETETESESESTTGELPAEPFCSSGGWDPGRTVALVVNFGDDELSLLHADGTTTALDTAGASSLTAGGAGEFVYYGYRTGPGTYVNRTVDRDTGTQIWELDSSWWPVNPAYVHPSGRVAVGAYPDRNAESSSWIALSPEGMALTGVEPRLVQSVARDDGWVLTAGLTDVDWRRWDGSQTLDPTYFTLFDTGGAVTSADGSIRYPAKVDGVFSFVREEPNAPEVFPVPEAQALEDMGWFIDRFDFAGDWFMATAYDGQSEDKAGFLVTPEGAVIDVSDLPTPEGMELFDFDANEDAIDDQGRLFRMFRDGGSARVWMYEPAVDPGGPGQPLGTPITEAVSGRLESRAPGVVSLWVSSGGGDWTGAPAEALAGPSLQVIYAPDGDTESVYLPYGGEPDPNGFSFNNGRFGADGKCVAHPPVDDLEGNWIIHDFALDETVTVARPGFVIWL